MRMPEPLRRLWPLLCFALLAVAYHGRILFTPTDQVIGAIDIWHYFQWLHQYFRDELLAGRWPLWDPYTYCGTPLAANPQATIFYPPSVLFLILPVYAAEKLLVALHAAAAGLFMFLFLRRIGISSAIAILAALPFAFGGYAMTNLAVGHLTKLFTMAWIPLVLLFLESWFQRRGLWRLAAAGAAIGAQILAGEPQSTYYTVLLVLLYSVVRALPFWSRTEVIPAAPPASGRPARATARLAPRAERPFSLIALPAALPTRSAHLLFAIPLIALVSAGIGAVQLLPTAEFAARSDRSRESFAFTTLLSMPPSGFVEYVMPWQSVERAALVLPKLEWNILRNWEHGGYVGVLTLVLVGLSLIAPRRPALVAAWLVAAVAILLVLGNHTPVYRWLFDYFPGIRLFRAPARATLLLQWSLCVMAAHGGEWLLSTSAQRWRTWTWRAATAGVLAGAAAALVAAAASGLHWSRQNADGSNALEGALRLADATLLAPLITLIASGTLVMVIGFLPRGVLPGVLITAVALDLLAARPAVQLIRHNVNASESVVALRNAQQRWNKPEPFRFDAPGALFQANAALFARVECVNGYTPLVNSRLYRLIHAMRGVPLPDLSRHEVWDYAYQTPDAFPLRVLNVAFAAGWDAASRNFRLLDAPAAPPRAWLCDRVEVIADDEQALSRLRDRSLDPLRTLLLSVAPAQPPTPGDGSPGSCVTRRVAPGELSIEVSAARPAYLALSEVSYPGWRARVDGAEVATERAFTALVALPVPAGKHTVTYRYEPASVRIGALVSLMSAGLTAAIIVRGVRVTAK